MHGKNSSTCYNTYAIRMNLILNENKRAILESHDDSTSKCVLVIATFANFSYEKIMSAIKLCIFNYSNKLE